MMNSYVALLHFLFCILLTFPLFTLPVCHFYCSVMQTSAQALHCNFSHDEEGLFLKTVYT